MKSEQVELFRRFVSLLPHGKEIDLVILKAHLLIEEQIRLIIVKNLPSPDAIKEANLSCSQAIFLAQALLPDELDQSCWIGAKKLNNIRNKIAHNITNEGLNHQIEDFINAVPANWGQLDSDLQEKFELSLWSLFAQISSYTDIEVAYSVQEFLTPEK
ncbi:hypothetical protein RFA42_004281 [Vibrio vulnificus]|uniref:hypothetical protein n=1 Tax=Vibrio vulnificus TaxID=672 RepID=UPI001029A1B0|nr:hypothetical protein [Vibrio vulnificus]EKD7165505.1 hypothetical protein [Vibrio vulnificus]EKZ9203458.1 hypothetical protein [Vibrio vulnificus]ELV8742430.1 hypothetical protein [Vibrio vulnificus]MCA3975536.1 hypothetical protein [Vibrio vulnificus]MCG6295822.1 hypothetical protein [Vibrio vulnificus]